MRISDWSSDVCSSDLQGQERGRPIPDIELRIVQVTGAAPRREFQQAVEQRFRSAARAKTEKGSRSGVRLPLAVRIVRVRHYSMTAPMLPQIYTATKRNSHTT